MIHVLKLQNYYHTSEINAHDDDDLDCITKDDDEQEEGRWDLDYSVERLLRLAQ